MKGGLLINKMQLQILNPLSSKVVYRYCDKSFINKPAFLNFVPYLIKTIYCVGTIWFYIFAYVIVVQAHISLRTRLLHEGLF